MSRQTRARHANLLGLRIGPGGEGQLRPLLGDFSGSEYNDHDMTDEELNDAENPERRRPRVVDRRISARQPERRGDQTAEGSVTEGHRTPSQPSPAEQQSARAEGHDATPPAAGTATPEPGPQADTGEPIWTPEQEEEARRVIAEIARIPSRDWVADSAVRLANVAGVKLDQGSFDEAQLAIDALDGILGAVGSRLGDVEGPLRQTVSQLKMAYAQRLSQPGA